MIQMKTMSNNLEEFTNAVELMSNDEICTQIFDLLEALMAFAFVLYVYVSMQ